MSDPYAAIAKPVQSDPYAAIAAPVAAPAKAPPKPQPKPQPEREALARPAVTRPAYDFAAMTGVAPMATPIQPTAERRQNVAARVEQALRPTTAANGTGNIGLRVMQAGKSLGAGLLRSVAPVLPRDLSYAANDRAANMEAFANAPIAGDVKFEDINGPGSLARFVGQQVPGSVATMAGLANPVGLATYVTSLAGQIGQQRAANDGRTDTTVGDIATAAPFAAASAALDRLGFERLLHGTGATLLGRVGKSALTEGATEGVQSGIEYTGGTAGTQQGFDLGEALRQAAAGTVAGVAMGGGIRGGVEAVQAAPRAFAPINPDVAPVEQAPALPAPEPQVAALPEPVADPYAQIAQPVAAPEPVPAPGKPAEVVAPPPEPVKAEPVPAPVEATKPVASSEPAAEPAPLRPDPGPVGEGERLVRTPAGGAVRTRMEVVDASTLKQAEGANQNRDRSRETTDLQVQDIISRFDPEQLGEDPSSDRGAPIVGTDGSIDSGNGRMLALNKIYEGYPEQAAKYRAFIESKGFSTEGIERPVLIQRRLTDFTPEQRRQFVIDSNKDTKLELSPTERARGDADAITPEMLSKYAGGDLNSTANAQFVQAFNGRLTTGELGNMIGSDRRLTTAGIQRIENAVVAAAYGKPKLLERMMEATNDDIRSITGSLADVAAPWAKLRQAAKAGEIDAKYDITDDLADAAARVSDARKRGIKPADIIAQQDAFDQMTPVATELVRAFHNATLTRAASRKAVSTLLADYIAAAQSEKAGEGLFGPEPGREPADILKDLLEQRDNPNGAGLALEDKAAEEITTKPLANNQKAPKIASEEITPDTAEDKPDYGPIVEDRGPYDPSFATASFTNRVSLFNSAAEALGMDPDRFTLLPAPRQVALLQRAMREKFGVDVIVDRGMQERFAIDQMLDAYQNVQGMAHVLDLPAIAISLGGKLKIQLQKKGNFLGAFQPGTNMIMLPKRSNSFAHEWGHALDWHLLAETDVGADTQGRGLTGVLRQLGSDLEPGSLPTNVQEAFVRLLNAMFFDKAALAARIMALEAKIAQTKSASVKAEAQGQIDRIKGGNSKARGVSSAFYKNAASLDKTAGDYWTSPTEMFARAFEAYVSYKVEAAGLTTEFIGKGDANYLSDAEERFAKTFPKGEERALIFAAFERMFGHLAEQQVLANGPAAEKPSGSVRSITAFDKTPAQSKEGNFLTREVKSIRADLVQRKKEIANRPDSVKGKFEMARDLQGSVFMSMTGNLRMIQARSNSPTLQKLIDLLSKQDGRGDRTVSRTFAEDVQLQSRRAVNRVNNILKANKIETIGRNAYEDMLLRDLLTGSLSPDGTPGPNAPAGYVWRGDPPPAAFVKAAAQLRLLADNEFYVNQQAGIDLGYTRSGYLARVLDLPKVYGNQEGFVRDAAKVYEIVFAKEFADDMDALIADEEKFPRFLKLANYLVKKGYDIPGLDEVRQILKELNRTARAASAAKKKGDGDVASKLEARVEELTSDLSEALGEIYDDVKGGYAKDRAEAWLAKINLVAGEEHNAASPDSKYTKSRDLPPEADKLLEQYYLADPIESLINYFNVSARRTAYARRFGADGKKRKEMFERMAAEGVSPEDQRNVERILDIATGRMRSELPQAMQSSLAFLNAAGTMALLPRATLSSLAEPFTAGLVTGNAMDGFKIVGKMIGAALGSPSGKTRYELARAIGIVSDATSDSIMMARYGQTYADETRWDRYTAEMFRATGLSALTRAQKTAVVGLGHAFLDNLSQKLLSGSATAKANALALLREFGIRDPEAFAQQMAASGKMPTVEELDSEYGQDYATAQLRFSDMVIQNPDAMDRPEMVQNPVGRIIYGITGFSYAYWRNIIKRNGILIAEMAKRDKPRAALYSSQLFAAAAVAYLLGTTISTIREALLNPERWKDLEERDELWSTMLQLGLTRTFSFGAADTVIQTWTGLKYQRDLSNAFVGAGPGFFLQNTQKVSKLAVANSRKTNTAEYNAVQGAYSTLSPFLAFGLARLPGTGVIATIGKGAGMAYLTSPNARDLVAKTVAGDKQRKPSERKPTKLDTYLDEHFPKETKERE